MFKITDIKNEKSIDFDKKTCKLKGLRAFAREFEASSSLINSY